MPNFLLDVYAILDIGNILIKSMNHKELNQPSFFLFDDNLKHAIYRGQFIKVSRKNRKFIREWSKAYFGKKVSQQVAFWELVKLFENHPDVIASKQLVTVESENYYYKVAQWFVPIFIKKIERINKQAS